MENASESRRAARRAVEIECEVIIGDAVLRTRCENLSPFGMWLAWPTDVPDTAVHLELGDEVAVTLQLPSGEDEVTLFARVLRGSTYGMGLEIVGTSDAEKTLLAKALRGIPPRLPTASGIYAIGESLEALHAWSA